MAKQLTKEQYTKLPKYVSLNGSFLRLHNPEHNQFPGWKEYYAEYFRDAGLWSVNIKIKEGVVYSSSSMDWLNDIELVSVTYEEWYQSNKGSVTRETRAHEK